MGGVGRICKMRVFRPEKEARDFERSVLKYVSIKILALTHSGRKSRVCVNTLDRLTHSGSPFFAFDPAEGWLLPALRALDSALRRSLGRLRGARFRLPGVVL